MNQEHLNKLISIGENDKGYKGSNSLKWANYVLPNIKFDNYLDRELNRYELFEYCANKKNENLNVLVAILSWGGMNRKHGIKLLNQPETVLDLVENLRIGAYKSRKTAFEAFQKNRTNNLLPGLGIGYYTKLICFLAPKLNGYIMDQWVSKSINLLEGEENENIVHLTNYRGSGWVNDNNNNAETYEKFCSRIDDLSSILGCTGIEAERRLFSVGHGQGVWRKYLVEHYNR